MMTPSQSDYADEELMTDRPLMPKPFTSEDVLLELFSSSNQKPKPKSFPQ